MPKLHIGTDNVLPHRGILKMLQIQIAKDDFAFFYPEGYRLCFATKNQGNDYNVVWQAYGRYLPHNNFSWTPHYELFGTNSLQEHVTVSRDTNSVSIEPGQSSTLDRNKILTYPVSDGPQTDLTMVNEYGPVHLGVSQLCTGIDGKQSNSPIYVATDKTNIRDKTTFTPTERILVWFEKNIETGTMFKGPRHNALEIDFRNVNQATWLCENKNWRCESR